MSFQGRTPTFKPGFGKVLTATEVPLSNKPIKRAAMSHMWYVSKHFRVCLFRFCRSDDVYKKAREDTFALLPFV